ncbi:MAG: fasciclin domain-containing protein [Thermoanaerobaculia bacterium]
MKFITGVTLSLLLVACGSMHNNDMSSTKSMSMQNKSIAEVAMSTGMHNTLVKALKAAGLADMLMQSGDYTVFAPTDAAFAKLPAGTVEMLLRPENRDKLRALLQYHVVPGRVTAQQVMGMSSAKTVSGQTLPVMVMGKGVMVGNANVVKADIMASNGIVHVIDTVLMPPGM